jgi:hypothetical protein
MKQQHLLSDLSRRRFLADELIEKKIPDRINVAEQTAEVK